MDTLNEVVQDAKSLEAAAKNHAASKTEEGISQEDIQSLTAAIADTQAKNKAQQDAIVALRVLTEAQDRTMERAFALIRKVQTAAKGVYGEDEKMPMKEFHVGSKVSSTVKGMMSELKYMGGVTAKRFNDLSKSGLKQADLDKLEETGAELDDTDSLQENAKKKQKSATQVRDESLDTLWKTMKKIRNKAKVIFADKPTILMEFESIIAKKSGKKQEPATPSAAASKSIAA